MRFQNLYHIPSLFKITQGKNNSIEIQILEIKAYVDDGFDFIIEKPEDANQFVGVWNYETMEFIMDKSSFALAREIAHKYISFIYLW
ncbi:DUF6402 family protein [Helicobacter sp. MIT 14-3879]|uniref:DUF6402 family protein n=1 Tax=Helicobacter sp. MIT 14-3879 TaxID=2040649 RepID=UPI002161199D|nr:hypothetical protein [Helicobacter sp. MIT 14-3879]